MPVANFGTVTSDTNDVNETIRRLEETNRRLNRRAQEAESSLHSLRRVLVQFHEATSQVQQLGAKLRKALGSGNEMMAEQDRIWRDVCHAKDLKINSLEHQLAAARAAATPMTQEGKLS